MGDETVTTVKMHLKRTWGDDNIFEKILQNKPEIWALLRYTLQEMNSLT